MIRWVRQLLLKLALLGSVVTVVVLVMRWHNGRSLAKFCSALRAGTTRSAVRDSALSEGFRVQQSVERDQIAIVDSVPGLEWCIVYHDGSRIVRTRFVRE
jgi:hypothetical protein